MIPFETYKNFSTERILAMFWTRAVDAMREFFELKEENRCKDSWLRPLLKRARHGNLDHELYCFLHGLPTKHPGCWMHDANALMCGSRTCGVLTAAWQEEVLSHSKIMV